jgi:GTP cyclohydrolase I
MNAPMPDVQGAPDDRRIDIAQVGVRGVRHPVLLRGSDGEARPSVAAVDMTVHLPHDRKGTHMSRFLEILHAWEHPLDPASLESLVAHTAQRLDAAHARVDLRLPYFRRKTAPVSGLQSLLDYAVTLSARWDDGRFSLHAEIVVPVTSLCPCSKEISDYGAHNQRSHVTVAARLTDGAWLDDLILPAEAEGSAQLYAILKRADEKFVTERAYDNPKFVEDLVRDVAARLHADARLHDWWVTVENFESIHNHSAWALIRSEDLPARPTSR